MPDEKVKMIFKVLGKLKQKVIMKWDTSEKMPKNVLIGKWLPQDDILAHKNLKLFISHCGLGGIVESKFHGVPILGIPLFADQLSNAISAVGEGWAKKLDIKSLTGDIFYDSIMEMIESDS